MIFAYADPPYLGQAKRYKDHPDAVIWDSLDAHEQLIARLCADYEHWALSMSTPSLLLLVPSFPRNMGIRIMAWVKPFAIYKPGVNPAYAWEPVVVCGGRALGRDVPTVRDWVSCNITIKRGLSGAKPVGFCDWLFTVMGAEPGDEFVDLFPGTGGVTRAWDAWIHTQEVA